MRRLEPGEMSLRVVSSAMVERVLLLLWPFAMRSGVTVDFTESKDELSCEEDETAARRRLLRRGGRFSASAIVDKS